MTTSITVSSLLGLIGGPHTPRIVDVRRRRAYEADTQTLPTAVWHDHAGAAGWAGDALVGADIVVYCAHGEQLSQGAAADMRAAGLRARYLEGGIDAWNNAGAVVVDRSALGDRFERRPTRWITRERPKVDRTACPWLIRRFIDPDAKFLFVAPDWVRDAGSDFDAVPFDVAEVEFGHRGDRCTFDALIERFGLADPALDQMARIIRAADTGRPEAEPQASGVLALCQGISANTPDDHVALARAMEIHDALFGWCRHVQGRAHD